MKRIMLIMLLLLLTVTLSACGGDEEKGNTIYVTVYPVQFLIEAIAGDTITVERVPGSTVHSESVDWQPKEIIDMKDSDIIFYVNAGLDSYIPNSADSTFKGSNAILIDLSEAIEYGKVCVSTDHSHSHDETDSDTHDDTPFICDENSLQEDPHFWLDPVRFLDVARFIKVKLILQYPEQEELFEANFAALEIDLVQLHEDFSLMSVQVEKPIIATTLLPSYVSSRYSIDLISMSTSLHSTTNVPGDLIEYTEEIRLHNLKYIIFEKNAYSYAGDTLYDELNGDDYEIEKGYFHGLGNLTTEEMDAGEDYFSIMYDNLTMLHISTK